MMRGQIVSKEEFIMSAIAGDFNYREVKLLANANSDIVSKYVGKIIDRRENDPDRHRGKIFMAYTTASNGWDIAKGFICVGYSGWEDVECQPEYGWPYIGVKTFFKKVVPISCKAGMYFDKRSNYLIFEKPEDGEAFKELFRKMVEELE